MTEWRDVSPLDVVRAGRWRNAAFFTYALSLSFFEGIVLPHLRRGGLRQADVFADIQGVVDALSEAGARDVGRAYDVHPVRVRTGVFHPKLSILDGDELHILVGSGNLTFGGWGANTEALEHLTPGTHPAAIADACGFLEHLATQPDVKLAEVDTLTGWIERLNAASGGAGEGPLRLLHSLGGHGIVEQLEERAEELGGAVTLTVASPYFGAVDAVLGLAERLSVAALHVHVPEALPIRGAVFPFSEEGIAEKVSLDVLRPAPGKPPRPEHAKVIEIVCRGGRLLLTGSANASAAALHSGRNVELAVLRIFNEPTGQLSREPHTWGMPPPAPQSPIAGAEASGGVLAATLHPGEIAGTVFRTGVHGTWAARLTVGDRTYDLGSVQVHADGTFTAPPPEGDLLLSSGRAVLTLEREGKRIRGFMRFPDLLALGRRLGPAAGPLLRVSTGGDDDADLAAILEWFAMNPDESLGAWRNAARRASAGERSPVWIAVADLVALPARCEEARGVPRSTSSQAAAGASLDRLLARLRVRLSSVKATAAPRVGSEHLEAEDLEEGDPPPPGGETDRALEAFERLWDVLVARVPLDPEAELLRMAELAGHILLRTGAAPKRVRRFVEDWVALAIKHMKVGGEPSELEALALTLVAAAVAIGGHPSLGRRRLLHLLGAGRPHLGPALARATGALDALVAAATPDGGLEAAWAQMLEQTSAYDDLMALADAIRTAKPLPPMPHLAGRAASDLRRLDARGRRERICLLSEPVKHCPVHRQHLPTSEALHLRTHGLAITDCCDRVLVNLAP